MAILKCWAIAKVIGDGTPKINPYRPSLSDDFPEIEWHDVLYAEPPYVPAVVIARTVCQGATALAIHENNRSKILAAREVVGDEEIDFVYLGDNWGPDAPFTAPRWTEIRDGLVALGVDDSTVDTWRTNNPTATPRDFYLKLKQWYGKQE